LAVKDNLKDMGKRKRTAPTKQTSKRVKKAEQDDPRTFNWILEQKCIKNKEVPELIEKDFSQTVDVPENGQDCNVSIQKFAYPSVII
jgi:hypothetical protein